MDVVTTIKHFIFIIIKYYFAINQKGGPDVQTALKYACKFDDMDIVDALIEINADPDICNKRGRQL